MIIIQIIIWSNFVIGILKPERVKKAKLKLKYILKNKTKKLKVLWMSTVCKNCSYKDHNIF